MGEARTYPMLLVNADTMIAMSDARVRDFAGRCAEFLQSRGLFGDIASVAARRTVEQRLEPLGSLGLRSEQAITLALAAELRCGRLLSADPRLVKSLARLPDDQDDRLDWLRVYLEASPEWPV